MFKDGRPRHVQNRRWIVLMIASWIQFIVRAVQFYIAANFSQAAVVAPTAATFRDFFDKQDIFVFLVTVTLGACIAEDRRANALQIYLSKPLTRLEYIAGKLGADGVHPVHHVGAGDPAARRRDRLRRQLHVLLQQHLPRARHHGVCA